MARFNEILVGRYNRFLQKLLTLKGGPPAPQLASEIAATFEIENQPAEDRYLAGWDRYGSATVVAAVALNLSGVRFRNPLGSNVVAVIERLVFSCALQDRPVLRGASSGVTAPDLGTIQNIGSNNLDSRARPGPTLIASFQNSAPTVPTLSAAQFTLDAPNLLANTPFSFVGFEHQELTLLPGSGIQFEAGTINELITFALMWRERFLEESERT